MVCEFAQCWRWFPITDANFAFGQPGTMRGLPICSATRLFVCLVLSRTLSPFQVNLYHQLFDVFCL